MIIFLKYCCLNDDLIKNISYYFLKNTCGDLPIAKTLPGIEESRTTLKDFFNWKEWEPWHLVGNCLHLTTTSWSKKQNSTWAHWTFLAWIRLKKLWEEIDKSTHGSSVSFWQQIKYTFFVDSGQGTFMFTTFHDSVEPSLNLHKSLELVIWVLDIFSCCGTFWKENTITMQCFQKDYILNTLTLLMMKTLTIDGVTSMGMLVTRLIFRLTYQILTLNRIIALRDSNLWGIWLIHKFLVIKCFEFSSILQCKWSQMFGNCWTGQSSSTPIIHVDWI